MTPSQAITTLAAMSPSGRSVRTPQMRPTPLRSSPVATVDVTSVAPASTALSASHESKSGRSVVHPL